MGTVCCTDTDPTAKTVETTLVPDENASRKVADEVPAAAQKTVDDTKNEALATEVTRELEDAEALRKETEAAEAAHREAEAAEAARKAAEAAKKVAKAAEDAKAPVQCEFTVSLKKDNDAARLGCNLLQWKDGNQLAIGTPMGAFVDEWNRSNPNKQVLPGDEIISVCGTSGDANAMIDALGKNKALDIVLRRQVQFTVELTKNGPFGLGFDVASGIIDDITDGSFKTYVKKAPPNVSVYIGDQLFGINDLMSPPSLLEEIQKCKEGEKAKFHFRRKPVA